MKVHGCRFPTSSRTRLPGCAGRSFAAVTGMVIRGVLRRAVESASPWPAAGNEQKSASDRRPLFRELPTPAAAAPIQTA